MRGRRILDPVIGPEMLAPPDRYRPEKRWWSGVLVPLLDGEHQVHAAQEEVQKFGVELRASSLLHDLKSLRQRERLAIDAICCQSIEDVGDRDDP